MNRHRCRPPQRGFDRQIVRSVPKPLGSLAFYAVDSTGSLDLQAVVLDLETSGQFALKNS